MRERARGHSGGVSGALAFNYRNDAMSRNQLEPPP
jgi:hypothetical protein